MCNALSLSMRATCNIEILLNSGDRGNGRSNAIMALAMQTLNYFMYIHNIIVYIRASNNCTYTVHVHSYLHFNCISDLQF